MSKTPDDMSPYSMEIARHVGRAFGEKARLHLCDDADSALTLGIVFSPDNPKPGYLAYGTAGLSEYPMKIEGEDFPIRLELLGVSYVHEDTFGLLLAEVGFSIIRGEVFLSPGGCLPEVVQKYYPETTVPHLYFTSRHWWQETLDVETFHGQDVAWLWAMPISEPERAYLERHDSEAFEALLLKRGGNVDLYRESFV